MARILTGGNRDNRDFLRFFTVPSVCSCSIHYTTPPGSRCLGSSFLKLNSARMLWHDAVGNAFLQIQMANLFSARLVGRFISESRFSLWVQRRFRKPTPFQLSKRKIVTTQQQLRRLE